MDTLPQLNTSKFYINTHSEKCEKNKDSYKYTDEEIITLSLENIEKEHDQQSELSEYYCNECNKPK